MENAWQLALKLNPGVRRLAHYPTKTRYSKHR